jgi:two-component system, OmpR family, phosphate regulon response regulator PhoB
MLVDHDAEAAETYRIGLEALGFRVNVSGGSAAFFEALSREVPDALVLDYRLPGMTGVDILSRVRTELELVDLPVFVLSNDLGDQNGAIDRVFELGAVAWLRKPLTPPDVLARRLMQAIGRIRYARRIDDRD